MNNINLIAFGTFGNPNGFKQTFFGDSNKDLSKYVNTFDLNTNAIKLFPGSSIYSIRKELANGINVISYSQYAFAKEQNSERSGTFIGSSLLFTNKIADESIIINILNEFQETLINRNVKDDVIIVNHSDSLSVSKPKDLDKVNNHLKEISGINFSKTSNKFLVVYCITKPTELQLLLSKSLELLNVYDTIYFTQSHEVAEFVAQKGIFKLDKIEDFLNEITILAEEKRKKTESSINEFEKEIIRLEEDKNKMLSDFISQIEQNEKIHRDNERKINESKTDLENIKKIYLDFAQKIRDLANQLRSGRKYEDVKYLYEENKRIFIKSVDELKRPNFTNTIPKSKGKTELKQSNYTTPQTSREINKRESHTRRHEHQEDRSKYWEEPKLDIYKLSTFILVAGIVLTAIAYFIFSGNNLENTNQEIQNSESKIEETSTKPEIDRGEENHETAEEGKTKNKTEKELNPKSNSELAISDVQVLSKKLRYNIPLHEVVQVVFNCNPSDIKSKYIGQEDIYGIKLVNANKNCFEEKNGVFYFVHDTLKHLPCFKQ